MFNVFEWLGIVGGVLIAGSYLPQIYKMYKTKTAKGVSTLFILTLVIGGLCLLAYSEYKNDTIFIAINASASILAGAVLALSLHYKYIENEGIGKKLRKIFSNKSKKQIKKKVKKSKSTRKKKPKKK